jgi:hypothetical protein
MAEYSSAQEQSAQAPPSPSPSPTDPRNDSVEVEDSAPLLSSNDGVPRARISEAIRVLTSIALSSSILTLILLIATQIILEVGIADDFTFAWQTRKGMEGVIAPVSISPLQSIVVVYMLIRVVQAVFSLLISAYNMTRIRNRRAMAPPALNLLFDVLIAFFAIAYGFSGLFGIPDGYCYGDGSYEACMRHALPARILAGITLAMGIIFG